MKPKIIQLISALVLSTIVTHVSGQERVQECRAYTEAVFGAPMALLMAVHKVEGGKPGTISWNKNKTYDMGPMQFNSATVADLKKYGVTEDQMRNSECASTLVAGWRLSESARKFGDWQLAIAAYNCGEGCIGKAVQKYGEHKILNDVSELDIPYETKMDYVPKVMKEWKRFAQMLLAGAIFP